MADLLDRLLCLKVDIMGRNLVGRCSRRRLWEETRRTVTEMERKFGHRAEGFCWAFASAEAVEVINQIKTRVLTPLSVQQLIDCQGGVSDDGVKGLPSAAFEYIVKNGGLTSEANYPYTGVKGVCTMDKVKAPICATIDNYVFVPRGQEHMLRCVVAEQPAVVGLFTNCQHFYDYQGGLDLCDCDGKIDHAMLVVGYGTTKDGIDYWKIKNNWGPQWGDRGYLYIPRFYPSRFGKRRIYETGPIYPLKF